jgi:hypothetical protein
MILRDAISRASALLPAEIPTNASNFLAQENS